MKEINANVTAPMGFKAGGQAVGIKKVKKEKSVALIADELEEEESDIKPVYDAVIMSAPEYNVDDIIKELQEIDLGTMTPIDGLNYLYKLQNQLKNRWQ